MTRKRSYGGGLRGAVGALTGSLGLAARKRFKAGKKRQSKVTTHFKQKKSRSFTKTKRRSKKEKPMGADMQKGAAEQILSFAVNKWVKGTVKISAHIKYIYDNNFTLSSSAGIQSSTVTMVLGSCSQWNTSTVGAPVSSPNNSVVRWFDLNPNRAITGSMTIAPNTAPEMDRLVLYKSEVDSYFVNLESVEQDVIVYYFKAKVDTREDPLATWAQSLIDENNGLPVITQPAAGVVVQGTLGFSTVNFSHTNPRGKLFFRYYKTMKVHKFRLAAAATFNLKTFIRHNYLAKKEAIDQITTDGLVYPKGTIFQFVTVNGQPVRDTTVAGVFPVTFSSTEVGLINKVHLWFKPFECNAARINLELDSSGVTFGAIAANEAQISEIDTKISLVSAG